MKKLFAVLLLIVCSLYIEPVGAASPKDDGYIYTEGGYFFQNGKKLPILGATFYPSFQLNGQGTVFRSSAWLKPEFTSYIQDIVDQAVMNGINVLRPTDQMSDTINPYDTVLWNNMDYLFNQAEQHNIYVILDLSTFRNMLRKQGIMPYDSSKWTTFINFVIDRYKMRKNILYISIAGEVEAPNGSEPYKTSTTNLTKFYDEVSSQIYAVDQGHHLIQSGGLLFLNWNSGIDWQSIFSLPHINIASIHSYSDGDRQTTIPSVSAWAKQRNIPFMIDEFGFLQSLGDSIRADSYKQTFQLVKDYGIAGVVFWNLGPEVKSQTYDVSSSTPNTLQAIKVYAGSIGTFSQIQNGDANGDGRVNGSDYIIWLNNYGLNKTGKTSGDFNASGKVDGADYIIWLNTYQ